MRAEAIFHQKFYLEDRRDGIETEVFPVDGPPRFPGGVRCGLVCLGRESGMIIVSLKTREDVLSDFKKAFRDARKGKLSGEHYEISFESQKEFDRLVKNMSILAVIYKQKPKSVYELAKLVEMDVSNLNKLMDFFALVGAIKLQASTVGGRVVKTPIVEYGQIEFHLKSAS
jgi:predicted transcriptional regulator